MPAIPIIGMGISGVIGAYSAHKQGQVADQQRELMRQQSGLANEMGGFAKEQYNASAPALNKAMSYYMKLATGNRGDIQASIAPGVAGVTEASRGAERGIEARLAPGPGRDRQIAELYRQRAGQIGMMPFQARQSAIGSMAQMGQNRMSSALDFYGKAGSALTGASNTAENYGNASQNAMNQWGQTAVAGTQAAGQVWDWYKNRQSNNQPFTPYGPGY